MRKVIDWLFPRRCPVCGDIVQPEGAMICPPCIKKLIPVRQPSCRKCGKEVFAERTEYCFDCSRHRRTFDSGAALFNYNEAARKSMAAIKYKNKREYLDFYAAVMHHRFARLAAGWRAEVLVPVPVHSSRRRSRGFNQAEELAGRLSGFWNIPMDSELLIRSKRTAPQRELNPAERLNNLQEAFSLNPSRLDGTIPRCVILIDDIYTTGSTIESCSRILKIAGVREIHFLTICIGSGR